MPHEHDTTPGEDLDAAKGVGNALAVSMAAWLLFGVGCWLLAHCH